ncbi:MAG: GAF domain-containing protein [Smithella sp.]
MEKAVRILILEDNPVDVELVQFEMQEAGLAFISKVVMTEEDFIRELQELSPDLILSDYDLPRYNGSLALAEARRRCPDTPFILVTGAVTEDRAIDILTQGAKDYVLKNRLQQRLVPAVRRALAEAKERRARQQAEAELRKSLELKNFLLDLYEKASALTDKDLYDYVLDHVVHLTDSTIGFLHLVSDDQKNVILTTWNTEARKSCTASYTTHYPLDQAGNWVDCVRLRRPVLYNEFSRSPNQKGLPEGHTPVQKFMSVPVAEGDKVKIIFGVGNKSNEYSEFDAIQIQVVANGLQRIMAQRRAETARRQAEEDLFREMNQLQAMLNLYHRDDTRIQDIEAFIIEECIRISESQLGFLGLINADETVMMAHLWSKQAMKGCSIDFKPVEFSIDHAGIWAEAIRMHETLIVNDYPKPDPRKKGYPEGHVLIKNLMSIPVIKGNKAVAIMAVANKKLDYNETDVLHLSLFLESAWDILKRMEAEEKLKNRIKELNCLYSISEVARRNDIAHETILKECVSLLAQSYQFSDITVCRIIWDNHVYSTDNFRETAWLQSRPIMVHDKKVGCVEVCYLEERPEEYEGPFLVEECNLLNNIADILGKSTERRQSKEERERLILELRDAMSKIKTLSSLIPIEYPVKKQ